MSKSNPSSRVIGNMSADQLIALYAEEDRHPKALQAELYRARMDALVTLAYEHAETLPGLAEVAYDEMERRQTARANLLAMNPSLAARMGRA